MSAIPRTRGGKTLAVLATILFVLAAAVLVLLFFGGPERPDVTMAVADSDATQPAGETSAGDTPDTDAPGGPLPFESGSGVAPEGGAEMPLIPIPGCRCHSDDPQVVEEHSQYTLAECAECH